MLQTPSNMQTSLYIPKEWVDANPACILLDEDGNRIEWESAQNIIQEDGGVIQVLKSMQSDATNFTLQVIDKNGSTDDLKEIAFIPFSME